VIGSEAHRPYPRMCPQRKELSMKHVLDLFPIPALLGLLFFCVSFSPAAYADMPDTTFASGTVEIDGVKLH